MDTGDVVWADKKAWVCGIGDTWRPTRGAVDIYRIRELKELKTFNDFQIIIQNGQLICETPTLTSNTI